VVANVYNKDVVNKVMTGENVGTFFTSATDDNANAGVVAKKTRAGGRVRCSSLSSSYPPLATNLVG
jgi:hypothetical protein